MNKIISILRNKKFFILVQNFNKDIQKYFDKNYIETEKKDLIIKSVIGLNRLVDVLKKDYGYIHYHDIYTNNIINHSYLKKYINDDIINNINDYVNYNLKQINAAIIIQKAFRRSKKYEKFIDGKLFFILMEISLPLLMLGDGQLFKNLFNTNEENVIHL